MNIAWLVVDFVALMSAWYLGYYSREKRAEAQKLDLPRDYLVGLNYLLNEETDKAVDIFIKMLEVDSNTVETHLAVGKLFRKKGEVDRAIRIHQNLIARPNLDKFYKEQSLFELGQDYLSVGFLDRAESIFLEILDIKEYSIPALTALLDIYQQEKDWQNAIIIAQKLDVATQKNMQPRIAHYYCELAETALHRGNSEAVHQYVKEALEADPNSVRASLVQAKMEMSKGDHKAALKTLKRVKDQNPDYLSEAIESLATCYEAIGEEDQLIAYLMKVLEDFPHVPVVLILSERIRRWKGDKVAANFVADYVRRFPSMRGLHLFINLHISSTEGQARQDLTIVQNLTKKLLADRPDYRCISCGFSGKSLHWHCPGCKNWGSVKPIYSLEMSSA